VDEILRIEKKKAEATAIGDIHHLVTGAKGRLVLQEGKMDEAAWSCGMVTGLIHDNLQLCRSYGYHYGGCKSVDSRTLGRLSLNRVHRSKRRKGHNHGNVGQGGWGRSLCVDPVGQITMWHGTHISV